MLHNHGILPSRNKHLRTITVTSVLRTIRVFDHHRLVIANVYFAPLHNYYRSKYAFRVSLYCTRHSLQAPFATILPSCLPKTTVIRCHPHIIPLLHLDITICVQYYDAAVLHLLDNASLASYDAAYFWLVVHLSVVIEMQQAGLIVLLILDVRLL
jgi:hypothetical protein